MSDIHAPTPNPNPSSVHEEALVEAGTVFDDYLANVIFFDFGAARIQRELIQKEKIPGWDTLDNVR